MGLPLPVFLVVVGLSQTAFTDGGEGHIDEDSFESSVVHDAFFDTRSLFSALKNELTETTIPGEFGFVGETVDGFHLGENGGSRDRPQARDAQKEQGVFLTGKDGLDFLFEIFHHLLGTFDVIEKQTGFF